MNALERAKGWGLIGGPLVLLLLTLVLAGCSDITEGTDAIANSVRIAAVSGEVALQRSSEDAEWLPAVSGMQLSLEDTLMTAVASETDLDVDADQHVLVGEQVRMAIDTLLKAVDQSKVARLKVDTGALYVRIQRKLKTEEVFEVITPTCVMGVRGTEFVVSVLGSDSQVFVLEGSVDLALTTEPTKAVAISAGQMLTVPWGQGTLEALEPEPIDFGQMPFDMLEAILEEKSSGAAPYLEAIQQAKAIIQNTREENPQQPTVVYKPEKPYVMATTGHAYARIDKDLAFEEAQAYCEARGGHLMTITSEAEQRLAEAMMVQGSRFWYVIGLVQRTGAEEPKGGFEWVTGEPINYTRWHVENGQETEPSDRSALGDHENHVAMLNFAGDAVWRLGDWNDLNLNEKPGEYGFFCEWDSLSQAIPYSAAGEGAPLPGIKPEALTYETYKAISLGTAIADVQVLLGEGKKTLENTGAEARTRWTFQDGEKWIACLTRPDPQKVERVYYTAQQALLTVTEANALGLTEKDLNNTPVRGDLNGLKSLAEAEQYLGHPGLLTSRLLDAGQSFEFYLWRDAKGYGYQLALNTADGSVSHSFKNPGK